MKKFFSLLLIFLIVMPSVVRAENSFITLREYPYSSHILGEDLIIYGDTNMGNVTLGLYYPKDQGYKGYLKFAIVLTAEELRRGYKIPTEHFSVTWPQGIWSVKLQNGAESAEINIPMSTEAIYNRSIRVAEYKDDTLISVTSYLSRGIDITDNVISFDLQDNSTVKIFSWNNLSPSNHGVSRIFISRFKEGVLSDIKTYFGFLTDFGDHFVIDSADGRKIKLFYWQDNLSPI